MRLSDMNSLNSRKLNENMKRQVGWNFKNLNRLSIAQASAMLESVNSKIYSVKNSKKLHESEQRGDYNSLVLSKKVLETYLSEKAESQAQQQAAGIALKHKRAGTKPKAGTASAEMMKMSTKELEKYAGTKHKGIPEKVDEADDDDRDELTKKLFPKQSRAEMEKRDRERNRKMNQKRFMQPGKPRRSGEWGAYESENLDEGYSYMEQQVDKTFESIMDRLLKMAKVLREDGALAKSVDGIGGDPLALRDAYRSVHSAYDDVSEAHYAALGHLHMDESASQGVFEDEVGQAESIMAAQDMVDKVQGMLEDVGEMINEQLPPLTDNLRKSNSADRAAEFNSAASGALNSLMDAVRSARETMSNAVAGLSGEQTQPMSTPDADFDVDADDVDLDLDTDMDDFDASGPATGGDEPLGRTKRED